MRIIVTGGAGFIGSAVVRQLVTEADAKVLNVDKLTIGSSLEAVASVADNPRYSFERVDICDGSLLGRLFESFKPQAVMHLAAETHVDRSIDGPGNFVRTNVLGTYELLEAARRYWSGLEGVEREGFRLLHVSTDEVFGSLGPEGLFHEETRYDPRSPYSASKAGADHLAAAWHHTFGLPVITTNCSNNYGPFQFPEKLIPLLIFKAARGESLPVYGTGDNIRDWLFVEEHAEALRLALSRGLPGQTYNIGSRQERTNIQVVRALCDMLDEMLPESPHRPHSNLITFVADRPGHDKRYAIDPGKVERELGWTSQISFEDGLRRTVAWYLDNLAWCEGVMRDSYQGQRLGLAGSGGSR